jgi:SRSO17 transposase
MAKDVWEDLEEKVEDGFSNLEVGSKYKRTVIQIKLYVKGLMSNVERKNSWQLSEKIGAATPYRFQYMLHNGKIDITALQNKLCDEAISELGNDGIVTFDETGFLKKGTQSAGVQRQYSGTAGRIENCQIGTFMGYATPKGHTLLDTRLYIPDSWIKDPNRCSEARIPEGTKFSKKADQASEMYDNFRLTGHSCSWVTADEAYGKDPDFVKTLEDSKQPYVLCIPKDQSIRCDDLKLKRKAEKWAKETTPNEWKRLSAGRGTKGERYYDWLLLERNEISTPKGFERKLLVRRSITDGELAYYIVLSKIDTKIEEIVKVAGSRWTVEECFEMGKGAAGLDQYEVRSYPGWYRHIMLSMWALFILVCLKNKTMDPYNENETENNNENVKNILLDGINNIIKSDIVNKEESELSLEHPEVKVSSMETFKKKRQLLSTIRYKK